MGNTEEEEEDDEDDTSESITEDGNEADAPNEEEGDPRNRKYMRSILCVITAWRERNLC